jgi:hypothetical protein
MVSIISSWDLFVFVRLGEKIDVEVMVLAAVSRFGVVILFFAGLYIQKEREVM